MGYFRPTSGTGLGSANGAGERSGPEVFSTKYQLLKVVITPSIKLPSRWSASSVRRRPRRRPPARRLGIERRVSIRSGTDVRRGHQEWHAQGHGAGCHLPVAVHAVHKRYAPGWGPRTCAWKTHSSHEKHQNWVRSQRGKRSFTTQCFRAAIGQRAIGHRIWVHLRRWGFSAGGEGVMNLFACNSNILPTSNNTRLLQRFMHWSGGDFL